MSMHPSTHHEIAVLRHEERLVRSALASAHRSPADGGRARSVRGVDRVLEAVRAHLGAQRSGTAAHVSRQLS